MRKLLPAFLFAGCSLFPSAVPAVEMDADTELLIRCGAGFMIVANDDEMMDSDEEAENLRNLGLMLLEQADATLVAQGVGDADREQVAEELATEVLQALAADTDPGFETEQCSALVDAAMAAAEPVAGAAPALAGSEEIDRLMTCGAGFYVTSESAREEGDEDTARNLGALAETLIGRAEELMIEAGMNDEERFQLSRLYGEQVGTQIYAGEELAYDWDTCANLAY